MTELIVSFDRSTWQWHCQSEHHGTQGAAGMAEARLAPGVVVQVDAYSGILVALTIDCDTKSGRLDPTTGALIERLLGRRPEHGTRRTVDGALEVMLARCALVTSEAARHAQIGLHSSAWTREISSLEHAIAGLGAPPTTAAPRRLDEAQAGFTRLPMVMGAVLDRGRALIDPSWIPAGILELGTLRTERDSGGGVLDVRAAICRGVYSPEVGRIEAFLIDSADDVVIANAAFVPSTAGDACAQLVVGPGRHLSTVALVLAVSPAHLPSAALRMMRTATDLARRAIQARRLHLLDVADDLLAASDARWHALGIDAEAVTPPAPLLAPMAGELDDLATVAGER